MLKNELFDAPQIGWSHAIVPRQSDGWLQPKLALSLRRTDMDVCRLYALVGIEVEPKLSDAQNRRHPISIG